MVFVFWTNWKAEKSETDQWEGWLACWMLHDVIFVLIKFEECSGDVDDNNYQMWEVCSTLTQEHSTSDAQYLLLGQTDTMRDPYDLIIINHHKSILWLPYSSLFQYFTHLVFCYDEIFCVFSNCHMFLDSHKNCMVSSLFHE